MQALFSKSCKPVVCWADFADIGVALLRNLLEAMPRGTAQELIEPYVGMVRQPLHAPAVALPLLLLEAVRCLSIVISCCMPSVELCRPESWCAEGPATLVLTSESTLSGPAAAGASPADWLVQRMQDSEASLQLHWCRPGIVPQTALQHHQQQPMLAAPIASYVVPFMQVGTYLLTLVLLRVQTLQECLAMVRASGLRKAAELQHDMLWRLRLYLTDVAAGTPGFLRDSCPEPRLHNRAAILALHSQTCSSAPD